MDKSNLVFRQCFIRPVVVILMGLMFAAGCGNSNDNASETTKTGEQRPRDLDTLFSTNNCVSCDLSNWHLTQLDLSHADLSNANLSDTNLAYSNLSNADLKNANLSGANLTNTYMAYSNLTNANLKNANLAGAKLDGAIWDNENLTGATWIDGSQCSLSSHDGHCEPK